MNVVILTTRHHEDFDILKCKWLTFNVEIVAPNGMFMAPIVSLQSLTPKHIRRSLYIGPCLFGIGNLLIDTIWVFYLIPSGSLYHAMTFIPMQNRHSIEMGKNGIDANRNLCIQQLLPPWPLIHWCWVSISCIHLHSKPTLTVLTCIFELYMLSFTINCVYVDVRLYYLIWQNIYMQSIWKFTLWKKLWHCNLQEGICDLPKLSPYKTWFYLPIRAWHKVNTPCSVASPIKTSIFEWCVVWCGSNNGHRKGTCLKGIGLPCSECDNHSRLNSQYCWGTYYDHFIRTRIISWYWTKCSHKSLKFWEKGLLPRFGIVDHLVQVTCFVS